MICEADAAGLKFDANKVKEVLGQSGGGYVKPCPDAAAHESLRGQWWLAEIVPKHSYNWESGRREWHFNCGRRRKIPPNALIHDSAYQRGPEYLKKRRILASMTPVGTRCPPEDPARTEPSDEAGARSN
jgi:hypothetical protein